jgi:hypothetical protein
MGNYSIMACKSGSHLVSLVRLHVIGHDIMVENTAC